MHMFDLSERHEAERRVRLATAAGSVSQVCSSQGGRAILLAPHLSEEQKELVKRAAASVPLRYSLSTQPLWSVEPFQVVRAGHNVLALCPRPDPWAGEMGALRLYEIRVGRSGVDGMELSLSPTEALPPGTRQLPSGSGQLRRPLPLDLKAAALDIHKRSPEGEWSGGRVLHGAVPHGPWRGVAAIDGTGESCGSSAASAKARRSRSSQLSLYCYSIASKQWRVVQTTGPGPEGAQLLAASAKGGQLLVLSKYGDRLQAHSLDAGGLTWDMSGHYRHPDPGRLLNSLRADRYLCSRWEEPRASYLRLAVVPDCGARACRAAGRGWLC